MGSWWRSEEMCYVSIIISEAAAPSCIRELGILGSLQFTDLNHEMTPFQRRYVQYIRRCDEMERKIVYMHNECQKVEVEVAEANDLEGFISNQEEDDLSGASLIEKLEAKLDRYEKQLIELNKFKEKIGGEYLRKVELHHLINKAQRFIKVSGEIAELGKTTVLGSDEKGVAMTPLMNSSHHVDLETSRYQNDELNLKFDNIAGCIPIGEKVRFERMLYRATRGNCYIRFSSLAENALDADFNHIDKTCFIVFYKSVVIGEKIKRICDAFNANRYDLSYLYRPEDLEAKRDQNQMEMDESRRILDKNLKTRQSLCEEVCEELEKWLKTVRREKGIYHTLNLFKNDISSNLLRGRAWCLKDKTTPASDVLKHVHSKFNLPNTSMIEVVSEAWPTPPTHFETNQYTVAFQEFVNTYGVPRYQEVNPALFTAATFPFLFGVMYGDIGHGTCLALFGLFLLCTARYQNPRDQGMMSGMYMARYMLFVMGLMSVYAGLVYNDYFSLGLDIFGSKWTYTTQEEGAPAELSGSYGDPKNVYPFGVDPAWHISTNELLFFNSMKMKMSVILGISQMTLGIFLKGANAIYFKSYLDFFSEFVPCIIFDVAFFGYMVLLIFIKWSINWDERMALGSCKYPEGGGIENLGACTLSSTNKMCYNVMGNACTATTPLSEVCPLGFGGLSGGCQPPNLITTLINIALKPGNVDEPMFQGQGSLQSVILVVAFICVPWLLLVKPLYLYFTHKKEPSESSEHRKDGQQLLNDFDSSNHADEHSDSHGHGEFEIGEIIIHQAIETIEFVLGMVSNTASYLRLWALSLAHSELATVFWEKAMLTTIEMSNPFAIVAGYAVFASVTFGVLLAMDVLECFLHALRLHWVEFQNKFFKADGYKFQPFDFRLLLERAILVPANARKE